MALLKTEAVCTGLETRDGSHGTISPQFEVSVVTAEGVKISEPKSAETEWDIASMVKYVFFCDGSNYLLLLERVCRPLLKLCTFLTPFLYFPLCSGYE
jgi:hypothetical protein